MRNFREDYTSAVKRLPEFHMDADRIHDEVHHRKMLAAVRRKSLAMTAAAASLIFLCSVGTVTAVHFHTSRIEVRDNGFAFSGEHSKAEVAAAKEEMAVFAAPAGTDEEATVTDAEEIYHEIEALVRDYDSISAFREQENIVIAIPELEWLDENEPDRIDIGVEEHMSRVRVQISFGEKIFYMTQTDNRTSEGYASSSVFMGEMVNQRELTNDQGLVYQMFDSEEDGKIEATHAAISLNGRDLILNFWGFEAEAIDTILKQLDVTIYFAKE